METKNKGDKKMEISKEQRISKLLEMEKEGTLKSANKAWLTIYRKRGLC